MVVVVSCIDAFVNGKKRMRCFLSFFLLRVCVCVCDTTSLLVSRFRPLPPSTQHVFPRRHPPLPCTPWGRQENSTHTMSVKAILLLFFCLLQTFFFLLLFVVFLLLLVCATRRGGGRRDNTWVKRSMFLPCVGASFRHHHSPPMLPPHLFACDYASDYGGRILEWTGGGATTKEAQGALRRARARGGGAKEGGAGKKKDDHRAHPNAGLDKRGTNEAQCGAGHRERKREGVCGGGENFWETSCSVLGGQYGGGGRRGALHFTPSLPPPLVVVLLFGEGM